MAFIKISELASNDNNITTDDLLTVVDMGTGQNRKMTIGAFRNWLDDQLGDHYTSEDFEQDLLDAGIVARLDSEHNWVVSFVNGIDQSLNDKIDSEHAWNVSQHASLEASINAEIEARENADSDLLETVNSLVENAEHYDKDNFDSDLLSSGLQAAVDSEHTWNVAQHSSLQANIEAEAIARSNADSDINLRLDAEVTARSNSDSDINLRLDAEVTARSNADSDINLRLDAEVTARSNADSDINAKLDSEHAWNISEHSAEVTARSSADSDLNARLDSEHAWNISDHSFLLTSIDDGLDAEATARSNADSDLNARLDSEHAWNISEHSAEATARSNADSDINARLDSEHAWGVIGHSNSDSDLNARLDSEHAWNLFEHSELQGSIDAEVTARSNADSDINLRLDSEVTARSNADSDINARIDSEATVRFNSDSDLNGRLDSEHAWNVAEHSTLQSNIDVEATARSNADSDLLLLLDSEHAWNDSEHSAINARIGTLTTDGIAEGTNLYYTASRVSAHNDSAIDSNFLNNRMPIGNLSDVQIGNTDPLSVDHYLQWNGSVWENSELVIEQSIDFKGVIDATTETAPVSPKNGDMWINSTSGVADSSWVGLSDLNASQSLAYSSDQSMWLSLGGVTEIGVEKVRAGLAISVNDSNAAQPTVSVDKSATDNWYYEQSEVDSALDSEHSWAKSNMFWDSVAPQNIAYRKTGNVGIGTDSPFSKTEIYGTEATSGVSLTLTNAGDGGTSTTPYVSIDARLNPIRNGGSIRFGREQNYSNAVASNSYMAFLTATNDVNTERMRIDAAGNVGIGTDEPRATMHLNGSAPDIYLSENGAVKHYRNRAAASALVWDVMNPDGTHDLEGMRIDFAGNVGLGTPSPESKLSVSNGGNEGYEVRPVGVDNAPLHLNFNRSSNSYIKQTVRASEYDWQIGTSSSMSIDASGNVGIGTDAPVRNLHVKGSATDTDPAVLVDSRSNDNTPARFTMLTSVNGANKGAIIKHQDDKLQFVNNTTMTAASHMSIDASGLVGIGGVPGSGAGTIGGGNAKLQVDGSAYFRIPNSETFLIDGKNNTLNTLYIDARAPSPSTSLPINVNRGAEGYVLYSTGSASSAAYMYHDADGTVVGNNAGGAEVKLKLKARYAVEIHTGLSVDQGTDAAQPTLSALRGNVGINGTPGSSAGEIGGGNAKLQVAGDGYFSGNITARSIYRQETDCGGLLFSGNSTDGPFILPIDNAGTYSDGLVSLGNTRNGNYRFKDAHFSGVVKSLYMEATNKLYAINGANNTYVELNTVSSASLGGSNSIPSVQGLSGGTTNFSIRADGNAHFSGTVKATDFLDANGNSIVNKQQVLTQSEYDALTPDPDTVYFIV